NAFGLDHAASSSTDMVSAKLGTREGAAARRRSFITGQYRFGSTATFRSCSSDFRYLPRCRHFVALHQ
ncbi:MAG: hypothetical protein WBV65_17675, partial [Xanthobacteraceae bacterium]